MWTALIGIAAKGYTLYQQSKAQKEAVKDYDRQNYINRALATEQLAITYNSILMKSLETGALTRRKVFELMVAERQQEGAAIAQAAAAGVTGRRAELARQMAINGGTERLMTDLEIDSKREQDALIMRADAEERAMINRLISNTPDAPADFTSANVADFTAGALDDILGIKKRKDDLDTKTVDGAFNPRNLQI